MDATAKRGSVGMARGIGIGIAGSFAGTALMDTAIMTQYRILGMPALTYLELIGSIFGRGLTVGILAHVLLAALLGVAFALPVFSIDALRITSSSKALALGMAAGVLTISACVPFALLVGEPIPSVLTFMVIPHLVWGLGLGVVVGYGWQWPQ